MYSPLVLVSPASLTSTRAFVTLAAMLEKALPWLEVWRGMPHVHAFFSILPEARIAIERMAQFIHSSELDPLPDEYGWSD